MKKGFALAAIAALVIALSAIASIPSVRAQVGDLLRWFRFESPAGGGEVSIPGSVEFTPLRPAYLPAGFQAMTVGLNPEAASLNYWNSATNQILIIDEWLVSDGHKSLPAGKNVTVNGQPAALITGLKGEVSFVLLPPTPSAPLAKPADSDQVISEPAGTASQSVTYTDGDWKSSVSADIPGSSVSPVTYTDGSQLVWYVGNIRLEMVSNLPVEEMLKIAEAMIPAEEERFIEPNP